MCGLNLNQSKSDWTFHEKISQYVLGLRGSKARHRIVISAKVLMCGRMPGAAGACLLRFLASFVIV
jgi:hypothetical protein